MELVESAIEGVPVQIRVVNGKSASVERILSTNPQDYLTGSCQPGQVLEYRSFDSKLAQGNKE